MQELHGPVHAVAQHTFWAQKPLLHSAGSVHVDSLGWRQLLFMQVAGDTHCRSSVHAVAQRRPAASHLKGLHEYSGGGTQLPAPSQTWNGA